jgi:hypothetical protein
MADEERRGYKRIAESGVHDEQELSLRPFSNNSQTSYRIMTARILLGKAGQSLQVDRGGE